MVIENVSELMPAWFPVRVYINVSGIHFNFHKDRFVDVQYDGILLKNEIILLYWEWIIVGDRIYKNSVFHDL